MRSFRLRPYFKIEIKFVKLNIDMIQEPIWRQIVNFWLLKLKFGKIRLRNLSIRIHPYLIILLLLYREF